MAVATELDTPDALPKIVHPAHLLYAALQVGGALLLGGDELPFFKRRLNTVVSRFVDPDEVVQVEIVLVTRIALGPSCRSQNSLVQIAFG